MTDDRSGATTQVEVRAERDREWRVAELLRLHEELDAHPRLRDRSLKQLVRSGVGLLAAAYMSAAFLWVAWGSGVEGILIGVLALGWLIAGGVQWAKHRRLAEVRRRIAEVEDGGDDADGG